MPKLTALDEYFVHQIPEPLPNVVTHHQHWRESLFFVLHPRDRLGDVVILTMAHFPARGELDSLQLGMVGAASTVARHARRAGDDPHSFDVGPVHIEIVEAYQRVRMRVEDWVEVPVALDLTFTARTAAYGLRRGTMRAGHELIWDQSHMLQSGTYRGTYTHEGRTYQVDDWWGQRDHSWGIRDHARCPFWMWLAVQLPDGMIGVWHWELANGARIFTDGCFAPAGGGEPVPIVDLRHELDWVDSAGEVVSYARDGEEVAGIAGHVDITLAGGQEIGLDAKGRWAQRYGAVGGGLSQVEVTTDDGRRGTGIYELTGAHHHRYFPIPRADRLPPNG